jgi:hypothetical protein
MKSKEHMRLWLDVFVLAKKGVFWEIRICMGPSRRCASIYFEELTVHSRLNLKYKIFTESVSTRAHARVFCEWKIFPFGYSDINIKNTCVYSCCCYS